MLTQKYKQQQQQVRVQTSESNYAKGMFFSDVPLTEGYSKVLVNWDIDPTTGKLTPRKGLRTILVADTDVALNNAYHLSNLKYIFDTNRQLSTQRNTPVKKRLLGVGYSPISSGDTSEETVLFNMSVDENTGEYLKYTKLYATANGRGTRMLPYTLEVPKIHNQKCKSNGLFRTPIGCYAFNNSYYTFLTTYRNATEADWFKAGELNDEEYTQLWYKDSSGNNRLNTAHPLAKGTPCSYYTYVYTDEDYNSFTYGKTFGGHFYYNGKGEATGFVASQGATHAYADKAFQAKIPSLLTNSDVYVLGSTLFCYTKLGKHIQPDDILLDATLNRETLNQEHYYLCLVNPQVLNPTEAASWGYNMLLDKPYDFKCEKTAANVITILGVIPYDSSGQVTLTPRKNQELTLKAYYRAPDEYYTDVARGTYYSTAKQYIEDTTTDDDGTVTTTKRDPKDKTELPADVSSYAFGSWWYCTDEKQYYMVIPDTSLTTKKLDKPSATKPAASVLLAPMLSSAAKKEIRVRWQIRTVDSSDWIDLYNEKLSLNGKDKEHQPFVVTTTMSSDELLVKFTISDPASVDELTNEETVITTNTIGLSLVSDELATTLNLNPIKYDLGTCSGMCEWEQRLVLWGVHDALNTVFVSDVNNPTFFPYPNNVDTFPDPVRAVYPFGDELLVLTAKALYRLIWDADGLGWTHNLVQQNLNIAQEDAHMCCVIKNMFFFKSGNYYYMMVPKNTSSGVVGTNTSIAPIAKPIEGLLDNFHDEITKLVETISDKTVGVFLKNNLLQYFVIPTDTKVIINYMYDYGTALSQQAYKESFIKLGQNVSDNYILEHRIGELGSNTYYLYVQLIYDTDTRAWNTRVFKTNAILSPIEHTILQNEQYAYNYRHSSGLCLSVCEFNNARRVYNKDKEGNNFWMVTVSESSIQDILHTRRYDPGIGTGLDVEPSSITTVINDEIVEIKPSLDNYQFLDTGNRDLNTDMKKRFREFQFKMRNVNATSLGFHTSFLIDGSLRRDLQKYTPRYLTDPDTGEMVIVIERTLDEASISYLSFVPAYKVTRVEYAVASTKLLQDDGELTPTTLAEYNDPDKWVIDQSAFPGRTFWKVRVSISGKGYTPRAQLLSTNLKYFEVFGHSWVYRTMHGR